MDLRFTHLVPLPRALLSFRSRESPVLTWGWRETAVAQVAPAGSSEGREVSRPREGHGEGDFKDFTLKGIV